MATITPQQASALQSIVKSVVATINETPDGAPGGILYAALMHHGCTLNQFESLMGALVRLGKVTQRGDCYFPA